MNINGRGGQPGGPDPTAQNWGALPKSFPFSSLVLKRAYVVKRERH